MPATAATKLIREMTLDSICKPLTLQRDHKTARTLTSSSK